MEGRGGGNPAPQLQTSVHATIHGTGKGKHTLATVPNMVVARDRPVTIHKRLSTWGLCLYLCVGYSRTPIISIRAFIGSFAVVLGVEVGFRGVYLPVTVIDGNFGLGNVGADLFENESTGQRKTGTL